MFAKILDKLEGGQREQQAAIAKFGDIGANIQDVKTMIANLKDTQKKMYHCTEIKAQDITNIERLNKKGKGKSKKSETPAEGTTTNTVIAVA